MTQPTHQLSQVRSQIRTAYFATDFMEEFLDPGGWVSEGSMSRPTDEKAMIFPDFGILDK